MIEKNSHHLKIEWGKIVDCCGLWSLKGRGSELEQNPSSEVSLNIREAKLKDIKALTEVLTLSFHPPGGWLSFIQPILKLGVYEDLRLRLRGTTPYYCCLVAVEIIKTPDETKKKVIGTIELSLKSGFDNGYLYISNLAVLESHRRKGIAKQLLRQCEEIASKWGYSTLNLHVLEDNYAAKKLYLSNGYQIGETQVFWPNWRWFRSQKLFLTKKI
ncbi:GNAT family N-acetyltransferase [Crocosphaera sp. Alani8]|uniref:GNAT family N-acetyltransferase n=1 Tax=Crocosphaera sp. Alani8 TaxID=3038952 RepID=UPI00313DAA3F